MRKPVVGITSQVDEENVRYWVRPSYCKSLDSLGIIPVVLPCVYGRDEAREILKRVDGVIFSGGVDVLPAIYGEETLPFCGKINHERDSFEIMLVDEVRRADIPAFGICRGIQVMNCALGGSLYQDISSQYDTEVVHGKGPLFEELRHTVTITDDTPLSAAVGEKVIRVNSCHHQAIKEPAACLKVSAVSEDGIIEGVYDPDMTFFAGVQWHPEGSFFIDENSRKVMSMFSDAVKNCVSRKE